MGEAVPALTEDEVMPDTSALAPSAPVVGVSVSLNFPGLTAETRELMRRFTRTALDALVRADARPMLLDATADQLPPPEVLTDLDGLVVLGGGDIHPEVLGHVGEAPNSYGTDLRADLHSLGLIRRAVAADMTTLAICRGSQLLNVAFGGTIIPDLSPGDLHHGGPGEPMFLDETVTLLEGTRVHEVFGRTRLTVRSGHHQAVDRVGAPLRVTAVADDGTVEGTEHPDRTWVVGVQWHPEDEDGPDDDLMLLFSAFVQHSNRNLYAGSE